ncbi:MAG: hypothetical protein M1823_005460 [Watsoniomyces obsoletus]|nr:MAG: hypothetical protein M1823_005460 [Watsoniomyces obsoletus]
MDFPADCRTGVVRVGHHGTVPYIVFQLVREDKDGAPQHRSAQTGGAVGKSRILAKQIEGPDQQSIAQLRQLVHEVREKQGLVSLEAENGRLWLFRDLAAASEQSDDAERVWSRQIKFILQYGITNLRKTDSGIFMPSRLSQWDAMSRKAYTPLSAPPASVAFEQNSNLSRLLNAQAALANRSVSATTASTTSVFPDSSQPASTDHHIDDPDLIHGHFISSLVSLLSYRLADVHGFIPLNFRTLVAPGPHPDRSATDGNSDVPIWFITIDVRLTTKGSLLIAPTAEPQPGLTQLARVCDGPESVEAQLGMDVWLAPGGRIARFLGMEIPQQGKSLSDPSKKSLLVVDGTSTLVGDIKERAVEQWKSDVTIWLVQKGIQLTNDISDRRWAVVEIWIQGEEQMAFEDSEDNTPNGHGMLRTILWPERLCFVRESTETTMPAVNMPLLDRHDEINWLTGGGDKKPFTDPLAFAEEWFVQRDQRAQQIKLKREAREVQKSVLSQASHNALVEDESGSIDILALAGATVGSNTLGDPFNSAGVYPTPPDGIQLQGNHGNSSYDLLGATPGQPSEGDRADVEMATRLSHDDASPMNAGGRQAAADQHVRRVSVFDLDAGNFRTGDGGPAFGHLDEDMFNEIGVTEADFSFFDDPDLDEPSIGGGPIDPSPALAKESGAPDNPQAAETGVVPESQERVHEQTDVSVSTGAVHPEVADVKHRDQDQMGNPPMDRRMPSGTDTNDPDWSPSVTGKLQVGKVRGKVFVEDHIRKEELSSPLSPDLVMKKLLPQSTKSRGIGQNSSRAASVPQDTNDARLDDTKTPSPYHDFDPVPFSTAVDRAKTKYDLDGRFSFPLRELPEDGSAQPNAPSRGHGGLPRVRQAGTVKPVTHKKSSIPATDLDQPMPEADSYESSDEQSQEIQLCVTGSRTEIDDSNGEVKTAGQLQISRKRMRLAGGDELLDSSLSSSAIDSEEALPTPTSVPLEMLDSRPFDWSMAGFFDDRPRGGEHGLELSGEEFISVAQIVADQTTTGLLSSPLNDPGHDGVGDLDELWRKNGREYHSSLVMGVVQEIFPGASECDLETYVAIEDAAPPGARQLASRVSSQRRKASGVQKLDAITMDSPSSAISKLSPPHIQVQRGDTSLHILPPALDFWESFGLGPYGGSKDVLAVCVHPPIPGIEGAIHEFIDTLGNTYEACRFGRHRRCKLLVYDSYCIPVKAEGMPSIGTSLEMALEAYKSTCIRLGQMLPNLKGEPQNVVIYIINPFPQPEAMVELCAAVVALKSAYTQSPARQQSAPMFEVVPQIIPITAIISETTIPILTETQLFRLALAIYERCPLIEGQEGEPGLPPPSALLAPVIPERIPFKLLVEPPQSLLRGSSSLHIAYSCSLDDRWISVAWSDQLGGLQSCASFCLTRAVSTMPRRPFAQIAKEIWERSVGMIQHQPTTWRFMIVKDGVMERSECDGELFISYDLRLFRYSRFANMIMRACKVWARFAVATADPQFGLVLLSVERCPPLHLHLPTTPFTLNSFPTAGAAYGTPASTPLPNVQSPDPLGSTPGSAHLSTIMINLTEPVTDGEGATLIDIRDETWAVVLAQRLRMSHSLVEYRPALASGLLVKRGGTDDEAECISVNIMLALRCPETSLTEILAMYRDLNVLARFKGVTDPCNSVLPWHLAMAIKAQETLSSLM